MRSNRRFLVAVFLFFAIGSGPGEARGDKPPARGDGPAARDPGRDALNLQLREAARTRFELGTELYKKKRYNEAIVELLAARDYVDPAELEYDLGLCYEKIERFDESIHSYERSLAKAPAGPRAQEMRDRIAKMQGRKKTIAVMQHAATDLYRQTRKLFAIGVGASLGARWNGADPEQRLFPGPMNVFGNRTVGGVFTGDLILDVPIVGHVSVELWLPAMNLIVVPIVTNEAMFWGQLLAKVYVRGYSQGFFVAPGVGALVTGHKVSFPTTAYVQVPLGLGYEFDLGKVGLVVGARPWIEFDLLQRGIGFGVVGQIELMGYVRKARIATHSPL